MSWLCMICGHDEINEECDVCTEHAADCGCAECNDGSDDPTEPDLLRKKPDAER